MSNKKIPIILDGDPGHDDAIAWLIARAHPYFEILAVTTVAGNQTLEKVTENARKLCSLLKISAPLAKGRTMPLMTDLVTAGNFHGESGLDGPILPESNKILSKLSAVELMAKVLRESKEKVTIVATGPQSNVASLLLAHPELKNKIEQISIMGGGIRSGNWTPAAEFNIFVDPQAAKIVFNSGMKIIMAGLDVTEKALVYPQDRDKIKELNNSISDIVAAWLDFFFKHHSDLGWKGSPLHDPCAILALVHPEIFEIKNMNVDIELESKYCRGATIGDFNTINKENNINVILNLDREQFIEKLIEACKFYENWEVIYE